MRPELLKAYRETIYQVDDITVRIGRRSPGMDRCLASYGVHEAAFITAHNSFSCCKQSGWNSRMQTRLAEAVRGRPISSGAGQWRRWSEDLLIVFGDVRPRCRLARRFRQNAIVIVRRGQPARLMIASRLA